MNKPVRPKKPRKPTIQKPERNIREYFELYYNDNGELILLSIDETEDDETEDHDDIYPSYQIQFSKLEELIHSRGIDPAHTTINAADNSLLIIVDRPLTNEEFITRENEYNNALIRFELEKLNYPLLLTQYEKDKKAWDIEQARLKLAKLESDNQ